LTYNELCAEVASLGFEGGGVDAALLLSSTRRALRTVFCEKDARGRISFYHTARIPADVIGDFVHKGGEDIELYLSGKSLSFKTDGEGEYIISDQSGQRRVEFSSDLCEHRELLFGDAVIKFVGDYTYSVYDAACYCELFGKGRDAIPMHSSHAVYDLKAICRDWASALSPITDKYGRTIPDAEIVGTRLLLPYTFSGKVSIVYKKAPILPSGDPDEVITLPDGCEHLLPLLVAAYVWLDDDSDKAGYYMSLYREGMIMSRSAVGSGVGAYENVNGWA